MMPQDPRVRVKPAMYLALCDLCEEWAADLTEVANRDFREFLERQDRWPPKPKKPGER